MSNNKLEKILANADLSRRFDYEVLDSGIEILANADLTSCSAVEVLPEKNISCCHLRLFNLTKSLQKQNHFISWIKAREFNPLVVLLTAIPDNRGQSLSNSIEFAIPQVLCFLETELEVFDPENIIFIEHYNTQSYQDYDYDFEDFCLVKICQETILPVWKKISEVDLINMLQGQFKPKNRSMYKSFLSRNWNPFLIFTPNECLEKAVSELR